MREWYSNRFSCWVYLTGHAVSRMTERDIFLPMLVELIETGQMRVKDTKHFWIYRQFEARDDNFICVAVVREEKLVIKTVMHRWELRENHVEY